MEAKMKFKRNISFLLILLIISIINVSIILAQTPSEICDYLNTNYKDLEGQELPSFIPYKNEIFNIYTNDDLEIGYLEIKDGTIQKFECNMHDKPTYKVFIQGLETFEKIESSDDPIGTLNTMISNKEIKIEGQTMFKSMKKTLSNLLLKIASWF
jgi:uncharacterized membrane protein